MRRIPELDALRGLAALVIVLAHVGILTDTRWVLSTVDLFFVLSGYFITSNVLKNRHAPGFLPVFFTRRSLRIWPAYYVALGACLVLNHSVTFRFDEPPDGWRNYLTFTQNVQAYLGLPIPRFSGMFLHTWTLAIEEQFYLLWPLLFWRLPRRAMAPLAAAFVVVPPVLRAQGYPPFLLLTRCDGLAFGGLLALALSDPVRSARRASAYARAFAALGLAALTLPWLAELTPWARAVPDRLAGALFTTRTCATYFGLAGAVLCLTGHPLLAVLRDRRLCYIGTVSYGLYLYHPLVFATLPGPYKRLVFRKLGLTSSLLMNVAMVAVCFLLAEASRRWLEGPVLALKDRLTFRPARRPAAVYRGPHAGLARSPADPARVEGDG
jgi:peptidoglycan/LPS O-acetylase OafA/YrhL